MVDTQLVITLFFQATMGSMLVSTVCYHLTFLEYFVFLKLAFFPPFFARLEAMAGGSLRSRSARAVSNNTT